MLSLFVFLILNVLLVQSKNADYMGYKIYKVELISEEQQNAFNLLKSDIVDYWRKPSYKHGVVGLAMVPPSHFQWFEEALAELGIKVDVPIEDVYEFLLEKENKLVRTKRSDPNADPDPSDSFDYQRYHRYDDILAHMKSLKEKYADSDTVSLDLVEFGTTDEGRDLVYLKIATTEVDPTVEKQVIVIESAIVPREWITIPSALYVVDKLLEQDELKFLSEYDWIIIPVVNPDGYEYTHTNLRLWTKSMSTKTHLEFICPGVHINRNFDLDWSVSDSSSSPCSHIYAGIGPLSEIESQMLTTIIDEYGTRIRIYISLQNSGGFISFPWQYEKAASGLFRQHLLLSLDMAAAMSANYTVDVASLAYGDRASGSSLDYARSKGGLFTFNLDIVQEGNQGVNIPEEEIVNIADDVWKAITVAVENANKYIP